jgi:hypothetical protein
MGTSTSASSLWKYDRRGRLAYLSLEVPNLKSVLAGPIR